MSVVTLSKSFVLFTCPQFRQVDTKLWMEHGRVSKIVTLELQDKTFLNEKRLKELYLLTLSEWRTKMFLNGGK